MRCPYCGKILIDVNKYLIHIEYCHQIDRNYECPFSNCSRSFHRRDNFKKHILLNHESQAKTYHKFEFSGHMVSGTEGRFLNSEVLSANKENSENNKIDSNTTSGIHNKKINLDEKVAEFQKNLKLSVLEFMSKLYSDNSVSRAFIQKIIEYMKSFLHSGFISTLKSIINCLVSDKTIGSIVDNIFVSLINCVNFVDTEYKRTELFQNYENFIAPLPRILGFSQDVSQKKNETALILKQRTSIYIPIFKTLKTFLQLPGVFSKILAYHNHSYVTKSFLNNNTNDTVLKNILDGRIWKDTLIRNREKFVIPLTLYFDDFEVCNPLGSHAGVYKLGAVYFTISSLPPEYASRLENIFTTLIFHSIERTEFGNLIIFNDLLISLKELETDGITIQTENQLIKVYFNVSIITGDNLGVHTIFGYGQSFSSRHCCRFCKSPKTVQEKQLKLNIDDERLEHTYLDEVSRKEFNIKEYCIWNDLSSFHCYKNHSVDIMHDLYEGVYRYDMALIVKFLIQDGLFSLKELNSRLSYFDYESNEKNKPPAVKQDHIQNEVIIFSASEMLCFVKNFRYIVGELVPKNNLIWKFYLSLLEITEVVTAAEITSSKIMYLEQLVTDHLEMYLALFPGRTLKPKHHLLLHYPNTIRQTGPVSKTHCMRFEAKHKELKKVAKNIESRKNIPLTIAKRTQIQFACRCMSKLGLNDNIEYGKEIVGTKLECYNFTDEFDTESFIENYFEVKWYERNGLKYNKLQILRWNTKHDIQFGKISHIFLNRLDPSDCYILCEVMEKVKENLHFRAYEIIASNRYICQDQKKFFVGFSMQLRQIQNSTLISF